MRQVAVSQVLLPGIAVIMFVTVGKHLPVVREIAEGGLLILLIRHLLILTLRLLPVLRANGGTMRQTLVKAVPTHILHIQRPNILPLHILLRLHVHLINIGMVVHV